MTKKKTRSSLCNPVMFSTVMKDEELFRGLLARILPERKVRSLRLRDRDDEDRLFETKALLHTEHSIIINPYAKSVRFDVLFEDDDTWFDVECQATDTHDLPQRSRYYHAAAAVDSLARGQEYSELQPSYVIFICLFDLFKQNEAIYSFEMTDLNKALHLNDGSFTIFLNSTCSRDDIPKELKSLFQLLEEDTVAENDPWLANLQNAVKAMENEKEVRSKMTLYDEWVRTATALEKYKKKLEDSEQARQQAEDKNQLLESQVQQAEDDKQLLESLTKRLLAQNRIDDLKRALEDPVYRKELLEALQQE